MYTYAQIRPLRVKWRRHRAKRESCFWEKGKIDVCVCVMRHRFSILPFRVTPTLLPLLTRDIRDTFETLEFHCEEEEEALSIRFANKSL